MILLHKWQVIYMPPLRYYQAVLRYCLQLRTDMIYSLNELHSN